MTRFWSGINPWVRLTGGIVLAGVVLSIAWYLGAPLLFDQRVDEAFPVVSSQGSVAGSGTNAAPMDKPADSMAGEAMDKPADDAMSTPADSMAGDPMDKPADSMAGDAMDKPADDAMSTPADSMAGDPMDKPADDAMDKPADSMAGDAMDKPADSMAGDAMDKPADSMADNATSEPIAQPTTAAAASVPTATTVPTPEARTEPIALRAGSFGSMNDGVHEGTGRATLYELPDGARLLRLEDFSVTNGPDLRIYLSADPSPRDADALTGSDSIEIARLKGNIGNQNYDLPAGLDLTRFQSVVIYCKRFHVLVSIAPFEG